VVPIGDFYSFRYSAADLEAMDRCDRAVLDASALWSFGRRFRAGDSLVLIAMHIMTKEQPGWTFQTLWWHDKAQSCSSGPGQPPLKPQRCPGGLRHGDFRPSRVEGPKTWQNYLLATAYGQTQQAGAPNAYPPDVKTGEKWPVAFNPYIELGTTHPVVTNCENCHHRAAWPGRSFPSQRFPNRTPASYLEGGDSVPDPLDVYEMQNKIFDGMLTMDSVWTASDRAGYPLKSSRHRH
jgi:hypothetical protein